MEKIWSIKEPSPSDVEALQKAFSVPAIIAQLLINRGITTAEQARYFLEADSSLLHDPFTLKGMKRAVERILKARDNNEKVLVYGDYDVDGVTSSTLLNSALSALGIKVSHYIPHRMTEGYGLNSEVASYAQSQGIDLLITVDCGTTSREEVAQMNAKGIDVIVIDHHEPSQEHLPDAYCVINPKQNDCTYPFKNLASAGLSFKLAQALLGDLHSDYYDLAAIGTVADIVPLQGENRIIVKTGLSRMHLTKNKGLAALLDVAKIKGKKVSPFHIGFVLGPRINAAGRMDSALKSLDLFLAQDTDSAYSLAKELDSHNSDRQKMQKDIIQEALDMAEERLDNESEERVIVLAKEGWHKGVLGIVASRISDKYYKPTIIISIKNGVGTGSARSVDGFHLHEALTSCEDLLEAFGGHEGAAGLTIKAENIDRFRKMINEVAFEVIEQKKLTPVIDIDAQIRIADIGLDLIDKIDMMEPFGEGNPQPVFCSRKLKLRGVPQVLGKNTLKFWVTDGNATISAVGFGMADKKDLVASGKLLDLAYEVSVDEWNKSPIPQLRLRDIRLSK